MQTELSRTVPSRAEPYRTMQWKSAIGQQQYSGRLWCLNDAQLVLRGQENIPHTITPPPPAWTVETRQDGSMLSCALCQILTLPSECRSRNQDSSDQATFLQSSFVQFWWSCVNCSLRSLFLADCSVLRMCRLVRDDRKATVTQITTRYNQAMQNTISERTTRRTLKQMGSRSRRPHRVPLLSAKNRTRRLQFTQTHQNWTIEDWKNVSWSDESWFLLRHSDGRVRIWRKEYESYSATSSSIMHHATKLKSSQTGFLNMTMSSLYSNGLHSHQISIQ